MPSMKGLFAKRKLKRISCVLWFTVLTGACASSKPAGPPPSSLPPSASPDAASPMTAPQNPPESSSAPTDSRSPSLEMIDSAASEPGGRGPGPEISRSVGQEGGIVVFWPRVLRSMTPDQARPLAYDLQIRLRGIVGRLFPNRPIDVRPEPERVCPREGCKAMTAGLLVAGSVDRCVVVALIAGPGQAETQLVPWGGQVELRSGVVPFREPPESQIVITDRADCRTLDFLAKNEPEVVKALKQVARDSWGK